MGERLSETELGLLRLMSKYGRPDVELTDEPDVRSLASKGLISVQLFGRIIPAGRAALEEHEDG